jgi:hypothetical protein
MFRSIEPKPEDRPFYLLTSYCIAALLDRLSDPAAAFRELQQSFDSAGGDPASTDLAGLVLYADIAARLHEELPGRHRNLARSVLRMLGVELSDVDADDPEKLRAALNAAYGKLLSRA